VFYLNPVKAFIIFSASYLAFSFAMNVQQSPEVVLSNRVNGLTTVALAFALSMLLWNNFVVTSRQKRQILVQRAELERVNKELSEIAFFDSLTGLPNRRYFDEAVRREHSEAAEHSSSIIEFDLDFFKDVNDKYGHVVGDAALRALAGFLQPKLRDTDLLCRYGGEEFIILLRDTAISGAATFAERLRSSLEAHVFDIEGNKVKLTASFGVMQLIKGQPLEANFYRKADEALYEAKRAGRNRVSVSAP
jgi:diguanylate cyclase (GGDEF)-like protein